MTTLGAVPPRWAPPWVAAPLLLLACLLVGCGSPGSRAGAKAPKEEGAPIITGLHLFSSPVGLNFDDKPGLDGLSVKLFAAAAGRPKAVPISDGTVEFVLHDGTFHSGGEAPPIRKVWRYTASQLAPFGFQGAVGAGYELALIWGSDVPQSRLVSISVRLTRADGVVLTSAPSTLTVTDLPRRPGERFAPLGPAPTQP